MMFLGPAQRQVELTLAPKQREQVREAAERWIESDEFESYFRALHLSPWMPLLSCLLAAVTVIGLFRLRRALRIVRECGTATRRLRRGYLELARTGQVVLGHALNISPDFCAGKRATAKGRILACAEGTAAGDKHSMEMLFKYLKTLASRSKSPVGSAIQALNTDVAFQLFRVRQLPAAFTGKTPVYFFETILHRSTMPPDFDGSVAFDLFCVVNPSMRPSVLGLPAQLVLSTVKHPGVRMAVDHSLSAG